MDNTYTVLQHCRCSFSSEHKAAKVVQGKEAEARLQSWNYRDSLINQRFPVFSSVMPDPSSTKWTN